MPDPIERLRALVDQAKPGAHPDTYDGRMALASAQRLRDAAAVALLPHFLALWEAMLEGRALGDEWTSWMPAGAAAVYKGRCKEASIKIACARDALAEAAQKEVPDA